MCSGSLTSASGSRGTTISPPGHSTPGGTNQDPGPHRQLCPLAARTLASSGLQRAALRQHLKNTPVRLSLLDCWENHLSVEYKVVCWTLEGNWEICVPIGTFILMFRFGHGAILKVEIKLTSSMALGLTTSESITYNSTNTQVILWFVD